MDSETAAWQHHKAAELEFPPSSLRLQDFHALLWFLKKSFTGQKAFAFCRVDRKWASFRRRFHFCTVALEHKKTITFKSMNHDIHYRTLHI
jgi:hypothetical protein